MATKPKAEAPPRFVDKEGVRRMVEELNERMGFIPDPEATLKKVRQMMLADGVYPEDNAFSREIIQMRYGDEEE
jgi:hypothetical protein